MRMALLALLGLSTVVGYGFGCGFGSGSNGGNGGGDPTPDARPGVEEDPDGDNVKTPVDNCPSIANPTQANDDADARGDACDTCPWKANESTDDPDNDQLTDDCDPDPRFADQLVSFEGFDKLRAGDVLPAGWSAVGTAGQWDMATANGTITGAHVSGTAAALLVHDIGRDDSTHRLYVRTAGLFGNGSDQGQAGISGDLDLSGNAPAGAFCDVTLDAGKSVAGFFRDGDSSEEGNSVGDLATPVALRLIVELGGVRRVRCDAKGVNGSSATRDDDVQERAGTAIGLRVVSGTAAFRYVAVLRLHPQSQPPAASAQ